MSAVSGASMDGNRRPTSSEKSPTHQPFASILSACLALPDLNFTAFPFPAPTTKVISTRDATSQCSRSLLLGVSFVVPTTNFQPAQCQANERAVPVSERSGLAILLGCHLYAGRNAFWQLFASLAGRARRTVTQFNKVTGRNYLTQ